MGDASATRSDLSTASYRRYLRLWAASPDARGPRRRTRARRSALAIPAATGALLLGVLLPAPTALAQPAPRRRG